MLADEVRGDYRYDFRVLLIPQAGPRTEADVAMRFVGLEDLGSANDRSRPARAVSNIDRHRPGAVCAKVSETLGVRFTPSSDHVRAWKYYGVRPESGAADRTRTDTRYPHLGRGPTATTSIRTRGSASSRQTSPMARSSGGDRHHPLPLTDILTDLAPAWGLAERRRIEPNTCTGAE